MNNCVDIGTIQSFLDGELATSASEAVAHHIGLCDNCANLLVTAEDENSVAFAALENEFNVPVPMHRLWTKINQEIESKRPTFWQTILAGLNFKNPLILSFASLLLVFGTFAIFYNSEKTVTVDSVVKNEIKPVESSPIYQNIPDNNVPDSSNSAENTAVKRSIPEIKKFPVIKAKLVSPKLEKREKLTVNENIKPSVLSTTATPQLVTGEDTYIKTIATLSQNADSKKDMAFRPSARIDYERNLAMVDNAISTMQKKARKNPKDIGAKQILFSSYQNKIDLLSSVSEKSQLIATLR